MAVVQDLAINGCAGFTDAVWEHVNTPMPQDNDGSQAVQAAQRADGSSALAFLSCVGCKAMRSCFLGMLPSPGKRSEGQPCYQVQEWVPARCHLSGMWPLAF